MRHAWKYVAVFGFVAGALSVSCTVTTDDDTGGSGTGGTTGGTSTTGGTGGTTGGTGGSTGGSATSGTGGTDAGTGGAPTASCDSDTMGTPYADCEPQDAGDDCEACMQASCCEETKNCYATEPYNVCGWGGPTPDDSSQAPAGEISCYRFCLADYVTANGVCDADGIDQCAAMCATPSCDGLVGTATSDLAACMQTNCSEKCFNAKACDAN